MAWRFGKIPQPPIDRMGRPSESRLVWIGGGIAVVAAALLWAGLRITRSVPGQPPQAREWTLVQAAAVGELEARVAPAAATQRAEKPTTTPAGKKLCPT